MVLLRGLGHEEAQTQVISCSYSKLNRKILARYVGGVAQLPAPYSAKILARKALVR